MVEQVWSEWFRENIIRYYVYVIRRVSTIRYDRRD